MSEFKVGDVVKITGNNSDFCMYEKVKGAIAIVRKIEDGDNDIGIEILSMPYKGHDLSGELTGSREHQGWWVYEEDLTLIPKETKKGFTIGDTVDHEDKGVGVVVATVGAGIGVLFDCNKFKSGHDLSGIAKGSRCGWWCFGDTLKKVECDTDTPATITIDAEDTEHIERIEYIRHVPPQYVYVARDKDGKLFAYIDEPKIDVGGTQYYGEHFKKLNDELFPNVTFESGAVNIRER